MALLLLRAPKDAVLLAFFGVRTSLEDLSVELVIDVGSDLVGIVPGALWQDLDGLQVLLLRLLAVRALRCFVRGVAAILSLDWRVEHVVADNAILVGSATAIGTLRDR